MKFTSLRAAWRYWVAGTVIAAAGVIVSRVIAPRYTEKTHTVLAGAGRLIGAAGLIVIAVGVSRRVSTSDKEKS